MRYIVRSVDGSEYGPFTSGELRTLAREGRLGPGDFIRREVGRTWSPFERIEGLSDLRPESSNDVESASPRSFPDDSGADRDHLPRQPASLRLDPTPARLDDTSRMDLGDTDAAAPGLDTDALSVLGTPWVRPLAATPRTAGTRPPIVDPAVSGNPFAAAGLPMALVVGEEVRFVLVQSFIDAFRGSMIGAILGHRDRLVCTDRRAVVIRPGFGRASMTIAWLDRVDRSGIESQLSVVRFVFGVLCLLYGALSLMGSVAGGVIQGALGGGNAAALAGLSAILGIAIAIMAGLLGLLLLATSRARAVTIGEGILFRCAAAGPWHLARIDEGRMHAVGERFAD